MRRFINRLSSARATLLFMGSVSLLLFQNCAGGFEVLPSVGEVSLSSTKGDAAFDPATPELIVPPVCDFDGKAVLEGATVTAFATSSVPFGQICTPVSRTCIKGTLSGDALFSSCNVGAPASCLFDGKTIGHNQSVPAFQNSSVAFGGQCVFESRLCEDGKLTGNFKFPSCAVAAPAMCLFNGVSLASGKSVNAYKSTTVPFGQTCEVQVRACSDGKLSGDYTFGSCAIGAPAACLFDGKTIPHGQNVSAFQSSTAAFGEKCVSENRICQDGKLAGTFAYPSCAVAAPAMCLFNGTSLASGQSVKAYRSATVPFGQACEEQVRTCTNGKLSGELSFGSCTVSPKPVPDIQAIAAGNGHTCVVHKGALKCWGANSRGQVGDGTLIDRSTPVTIFPTGVTDVTIIRTFDRNTATCAVVNSSLYCWGFGFGTSFVSAPAKLLNSGVSKAAISENKICAIMNGQVVCAGFDKPTVFKTIVNSGATEIVAGQNHFCATINSSVSCWDGVLQGDWGGAALLTETPVAFLNGPVKSLGGGIYFACATLQNDDLNCFGNLAYGGIIAGTTGNNPPIKVASNVSSSTGSISGASLTWISNKQLYLRAQGLGRPKFNDKPPFNIIFLIPTREYASGKEVVLFNNADLVSAGDAHICASMNNQLYCFGDNSQKQSGNAVSGFLMPTIATPLETFRVPL